ncbi:MAG: M28 family peptidase [Candidatus Eisenbacteria bacterium]|nr:M28 family peptidase [Candidatus Eisenbacteria bacterium]
MAALFVAGAVLAREPFDGDAAFARVEAQCSFGPRVPGTKGHAACLAWIQDEVRALGLVPEAHGFRAVAPATGDTLDLTNVLVRIAPEKSPRLLLGAHWDTRGWSDQETDPALRALPVLGANDGASGVAVLLGLAEQFVATPPPIGIDLVFFDMEDQGRAGHPREYCLGSQWMARNWPGTLPDFVLVLDMVGSPETDLGRDLYSLGAFPGWNRLLFDVAEGLGFTEFDRTRAYELFDDHIPFLEIGIPSAVIIGFDAPTWHTQRDVPASVSADRLGRVGEVVLEVVHGGYLGR